MTDKAVGYWLSSPEDTEPGTDPRGWWPMAYIISPTTYAYRLALAANPDGGKPLTHVFLERLTIRDGEVQIDMLRHKDASVQDSVIAPFKVDRDTLRMYHAGAWLVFRRTDPDGLLRAGFPKRVVDLFSESLEKAKRNAAHRKPSKSGDAALTADTS